jgi:putative chitinase
MARIDLAHPMAWFRMIGAAAVLLCCCAASSPLPVRLALIIGNASYQYAAQLPNALTDARAIAAQLARMGFKVEADTFDTSQQRLNDVVEKFGQDLRTSGPNVISLVYYAGHAAQDRLGINYMLPVDAEAATPDDVRSKGVPLPPLLQAMEEANNAVNIVVIDACRDWFEGDRTTDDPRGLSDMGLYGSVLIAYATRSNATADEGPGLTSSPYSRRFLEALEKQPTEPVALVFEDIQSRVYTDTDSLQLPLNVNGLVRAGRWAFSDGALATVADTPVVPTQAGGLSPDLDELDQYRDALLKFTRGRTSYVDALLKRRDILQKYGITTKLRLAYFLAAIAYESGGFEPQVEKFGYSASGLRKRFKVVNSDELARSLIRKGKEATANFVYANRFGNGPEESGDGWKYRGRGIFFITGKANYQRYSEAIGADLVTAPDLASDLETSIIIAAAVWNDVKANAAADADNMALAAKRFRGNADDMDARNTWLRQAKRALGL